MYPQSTLTPSKALKGVHGVHLAPQSPFVLEEVNQNGNINQPTCQNSALGSSQHLIVQKNLNCKLYASSLIGVGIASSLYHASRGKLRRYLRWADYTMIATSTVFLSRALRNENPKLLMAASALILPVQPLMVSALHTGMMEVAFAKRALEDPELRTAHNVHKMSSVLGGALFIADDVFPDTPFLHAAWHLAAAVGVGTCNKLL
ncbi:uncharacterized protein LOC131301880 isoform X1 [Rhododendron vialii]|uniref:uncharacterized protein LOC131301880 isoform X1 n=1 Tax=Rhododendron vialii TaxID=182163 RepID=UPI00265E8CBE|nr:uncharacterized protein LOC131301880 isoform X1 [Rhododendron vialii]